MKINLKKVSEKKSKEFQNLQKECETLFSDYFKKQYLETLEELNKNPFIQKTSNDFFSKLSKLFKKILNQASKEANNNFNKNAGKYGYKVNDFFLNNKEAIAWAETRSAWLISQVDQTTKAEINTIITNALKNSKTLKEIAKEIKTKFDSFSDYRAKLIAHMEVSNAYSYSEAQIFQKKAENLNTKGYKRAKTQEDDQVRASHMANELAGWIRADKAYPGTGTMWAPHSFACRCSDIYSLVNPKTGLISNDIEYSLKQKQNFDKYIFADNFIISQKEKFAMINYSLEKREVEAIKAYSGNLFNLINKEFQTGNTSETFQAVIPFFIGALNKLPKEKGVFYRKTNLNKIGDLEKLGTTISFDYFLSSSKKILPDFAGDIVFVINGYGINIQDFSIIPGEQEYIFMPNTIFKIEKRIKKNNINYIYLTEIQNDN